MEHIEAYLELCEVEKENIGIVLGPQIDGETPAIEITYSVRVLDGDQAGICEIDGSYTFEDTEASAVLDEIYPEIVSQFEETFAEAHLHCYEQSKH